MSWFRCCPHCEDDPIHDLEGDPGHSIPCNAPSRGGCVGGKLVTEEQALMRVELDRLTAAQVVAEVQARLDETHPGLTVVYDDTPLIQRGPTE